MKRTIRTISRVILLAALAILAFGSARGDAQTRTDVASLNARAAVLIDAKTGRVLYGYNENQMLPMASTTKVMTALLALENCSLDEIVTAGKNASGVPGTSIYLGEGEQLSMEQMLMGLMLRSGNDAAVAIAEHVAGSVETFAEMMNARAEELGADACFVTPNGLDEGNHSISALGLALVARQAMTLPDFRRIVSLQQATIPWQGNPYDRVLTNKNRLLREYQGATGIKTGFTSKAGRCLVFSALRDGMELIGVVLNCGTWFDSATQLLDWGFENYSLAIAAQENQFIADAPVRSGTQKTVPLRAQQELSAAVSPEDSWQVVTQIYELSAPVQEDQVCGRLSLLLNGEEVASTPLLACQAVERWNLRAALLKIIRLWSGRLT